MKFVNSPVDLAKGNGTPMKTRIGIKATAEPNPPNPNTNAVRNDINDTSTKDTMLFFSG